MNRIALGVVLFCVALVASKADKSDPLRYTSTASWNGAAVMLSSPPGFAVHRSQPAWMSSTPSISILDARAQIDTTGMFSEDLRAVTPWRDHLILVRSLQFGFEVNVVTRYLDILRTAYADVGGNIDPGVTIRIIASPYSKVIFLHVGASLWSVDLASQTKTCSLVEDRVLGVELVDDSSGGVAVVHHVGSVSYLSVIGPTFRRTMATPIPTAPEARLVCCKQYVMIVSDIDHERGTQLTFVNVKNSETRTMAIPADSDLLDMFRRADGVAVAALTQRSGKFELVVSSLEDINAELPNGTILPGEFGRPLALRASGHSIKVVFTGGIVSADSIGGFLSRDGVKFDVDPATIDINESGTELLVSSRRGSILLARQSQSLWWFFRFFESAGRYVIPGTLLLLIALLLLTLRRQRRILDAMLELPGSGLVFVIDAAGRLMRTNQQGGRLLRITKNVPMKRVFHAYMRHAGVEGVQAFFNQALASRKPLSEKLVIDDGDEQREYVVTAIPLAGTFGNTRSIVITGIDITEALERRRLVNWAQLAHDMQTNLSTIRLNAEQLEASDSGVNNERLRRILFQTGVLIQRVRDLVSVGRTEDLTRSPVHSAEFCTQIRHEFDPNMFPHVSFSMKLRGTMMNVDRLKLSRAVRNAVENAIKALRGKEGVVEIATWFDRSNVYIRVSDTGVGMDTLTLENMMKPYFTTAKDGSGTGIGTMIMQHVTHLHGGTLRVTSEPGEGTQVIFRIPHLLGGERAVTVRDLEGVME